MSQNLELRRLARDSSYNLIRQIWIIIIGLIVSIILARGLGAEQRGIYTLAVLLPEILVIFLNLGVAPASIFFISRRKIDPSQTFGNNTSFALWISAGTIIIGILVIILISDWLFPNVPISLLLLSLLIIPIALLIQYLNAIFQGLQDFRSF